MVDIYGVLITGGTLFCPTKEEVLEDLPELIRSVRPTFLHLTPTMISTIPKPILSSLSTLVSGGELLSTVLAKEIPKVVRLIDGYGPTECAVQISA